VSPPRGPDLIGLALAGGLSRRMAVDKGSLELHGETQVQYCVRVLSTCCESVWVSLRAAQSELPIYGQLPQIVDSTQIEGPAAGLHAAWQRFPSAALLVLAVDMPFVDAGLLQRLSERRNPARLATAFRHADGLIEPLCTIWEPRAAPLLARTVPPAAPSLRRILESHEVELLEAPDAAQLASVNTPEALEQARRALAGR
jgi:molybdopterin-guanine dinucleotide biosynthesis protein A